MAWDPARYLRFADHRTRAAAELLARIPHAAPTSVVDLGCGPGNSTRLLADRWPDANIVGIDSSEAMLARARADHPDIEFALGDAASWSSPEAVDVVYTNAALHWIDDHLSLLPSLLANVAPGGSLALQIPNNYQRPAHAEAHRIVREHFADLDGVLLDRRFDMESHYAALADAGAQVDVWETTYLQALEGEDPVVAWTSGTFLRPLLDALGDRREQFLTRYPQAMRETYPPRADGITLLPFPRIFAVATRD